MRAPDKRDECGCHRSCTTTPHDCDRPCRWPDCLTAAEHDALARELAEDDRRIAEGVRDLGLGVALALLALACLAAVVASYVPVGL